MCYVFLTGLWMICQLVHWGDITQTFRTEPCYHLVVNRGGIRCVARFNLKLNNLLL